jgi:tetratricopeptide (TPR) repeat protein
MESVRSGLVDIVRDFLVVHQRMRDLFDRFREGELRFQDVQDLVGDGEASLLFRLKERCHSLFRVEDGLSRISMPREALFDLAVGSLFHESMVFRENLYQIEIYGPKVRSLRGEAEEEAGELFEEFERILTAAALRLEEAIHESEALLAHTRDQLRVLLADYRREGLIARTLFEKRELVGEVFSDGLDELLNEIHGDAADGYLIAARSYLESAHFHEALEVLSEARKRSGERKDLRRLTAYAEGMQAFLDGRYPESLERLGHWLDGGPEAWEASCSALALSALSRVGQLVGSGGSQVVVAAAEELRRRLEPIVESHSKKRVTPVAPAPGPGTHPR